MSDGCSGSFNNGIEMLNKVRAMGFSQQGMPIPAYMPCTECGEEIIMTTFEYKCPNCGMIYAVTPCHAFDSTNILAAGKDL